MSVKVGDKIKVDYTGTLDDGSEFDSSKKHGKPLEFEVGAKQVIKGFDEAVVGMEKDEEKDVTLPPTEAYGEPNAKMVQEVPAAKLPQDKELKVGMMLLVTLPNGGKLPAKIIEVNKETVKLDLNHLMAGKTLHFKIKIVEITSA
tara:strand:+ start:101675 stop:102109 length:435 start_codon:yes stop_codon:yes gene_type:complete